ncbi:hypothetical protein F5B19DRAFT_498929 [Rostrohypoxylon terebratum]|nr:hypothetical protein F5B19DRAFT_498929 [Rostrohypoxylon terebratum]
MNAENKPIGSLNLASKPPFSLYVKGVPDYQESRDLPNPVTNYTEDNLAESTEDSTGPVEGTDPISSSTSEEATPSSTSEEVMLWHARLGHIGLPLLKKTTAISTGLPDFNSFKGPLNCEKCAISKATRRLNPVDIPDPDNALDVSF